jgi:hypothetical protein
MTDDLGVNAPFPTQARDWIEVEGEGVGYKDIKVTARASVGIGQDGSEIIMTFYRHANSGPYKIYIINATKGGFRVFGYEMTVLAAKSIEFNNGYPPLYSVNLSCFGRLMSEGRDFYVNGESFFLRPFTPPDGFGGGNIPNQSGYFRPV